MMIKSSYDYITGTIFGEINYEDFKSSMNKISAEIIEENGSKVPLLFSGGMDSTAICISLVHVGGHPILLHMRGKNYDAPYERTKEYIMRYLSEKYELMYVNMPYGETKDASEFYKIWTDLGFDTLITGDGMDRIYMNCYDKDGKSLRFSYGERFRCRHPILDTFFNLKPRLESILSEKIKIEEDNYTIEKEIFNDDVNLNLISYSNHALMRVLFDSYAPDVRDIIFRKRFTEKYIRDISGMSYNKIVRNSIK